MSALLHIPTPSRCPSSATTVPDGITMARLEPDERLRIDAGRANVVCVAEGLLYVQAGDNDVILLGGEQIVLSAGDEARAWNAGDEPAQVIVVDKTTM